tara:strand:+ start:116 stop:931 length:816 start_codon:yes stop_codon:yes gene_type:complete
MGKELNLKRNNMARTTGRSGFKMKSGNTTAFKYMGSSPIRQENTVEPKKKTWAERHAEWKAKRKEASVGDDGLTRLQRSRAEKKTRKPGESKFQADIRRKREAYKAEGNVTTTEDPTDILSKNITDTSDLTIENRAGLGEKVYPQQKLKSETPETPKTPKTLETPKTPKTTKIDWTKAPKVGTQARTDWYKKHNLGLDHTTPGYKKEIKTVDPIKVEPGSFVDIDGNGIDDRVEGVTRYKNPINKKSPYKKGIGKYAKKAKGSRGYKMKRK